MTVLLHIWFVAALIGSFLLCIGFCLSFTATTSVDKAACNYVCVAGLCVLFAPISVPLLVICGCVKACYFVAQTAKDRLGV